MEYHIDKPTNWICPHCERATTIVPERVLAKSEFMFIPNAEGGRCLEHRFIVCPNPDCRRTTLDVRLSEAVKGMNRTYRGNTLEEWRLVPPPGARTFDATIPQAVLGDYGEACKIRDLSPKASATLSRRCLQGMIRDFWSVRKGRLKDEIDALKECVNPPTWEAIDAIRKVGNIGAHMEEDVNLIIDVEPEEAQKLIALVELLIQEWYVARELRQRRVQEVVDLAQQKAAERAGQSQQEGEAPVS